jgi:hypothetical protein
MRDDGGLDVGGGFCRGCKKSLDSGYILKLEPMGL